MNPSWCGPLYMLITEILRTPELPLPARICGILLPILSISSVWIVAVAALGLTRKRRHFPLVRYHNRFAIVVCARNEEKALPALLKSIAGVRYPADCLHVYLIADHCSDRTADIGREYPFVTVYERNDGPTTGKGAVLNWGIPKILEDAGSSIDAFAVFDADNVVQPDFFAEINQQMNAGDEIIQGNRLGGKPYTSLITKWYTLYWSTYSTFFSYAREKLGLSAFLTGTGFAVKKSLLENGWNTKTITEDVEFSIQNLLQGRRTAFCVTAVCYDEQPWQFGPMVNQLARWCTGSYQILQSYGLELLKRKPGTPPMTGKRCLRQLDALMLLLMGPVSWISFVLMLVNGFFMWKYWQLIFWLSFDISLLGMIAVCVPLAGAARFNRISLRDLLPAILTCPVFMLVYILCSMRAFFFPEKKWKRVEHQSLSSLQE